MATEHHHHDHDHHDHDHDHDHDHHDHDHSHGEDLDLPTPEQLAAMGINKVQSRAEKKSRKALAKLGLIPVEGVTRTTFRRGNMLFVISQGDVYKSVNSDTYVVFGEAKIEDLSANAPGNFASQLKNPIEADIQAAADGKSNGEEVDDSLEGTNISEDDITMVVEQTGVDRSKAIKALKSTGDVVNAIVELTS